LDPKWKLIQLQTGLITPGTNETHSMHSFGKRVTSRFCRIAFRHQLYVRYEANIEFTLTNGAKGGFLEHREATVVDSKVAYVEAEEYIALQLGQIIVPEPKIEYYGAYLPFEHGHRLGDVLQVGDLANDIQAGLLHAAGTGRDFGVGRTELRCLR
jgi:hypothetical protein